MIRIMFVCHGNICRSPMAEFIFKDMVKKQGLEDEFLIESSATSSEEVSISGQGNLVYPPAKNKLKEHNISCEGKRAVQLRYSDYEKYDYIIGMEQINIRNILKIVKADFDRKVFRLMDFTDNEKDIADPWYSGDFDITYNEIYEGCRGFLDYIIERKFN